MNLTAVLCETKIDRTSDSHMEDLMRRLATGDRTALEELYTETRASVYGFALSITRNGADAEDVLQDTYIRAWGAAKSYASRGHALSWLLTITKNLSLMKLRSRSRCQELEPEEWAAIAAPDCCAPAEDRQLLEAALSLLKEDERQIVILHAVSGLRHREIAALLDLALPTVLSKYRRALKKLRKHIEGADAHD